MKQQTCITSGNLQHIILGNLLHIILGNLLHIILGNLYKHLFIIYFGDSKHCSIHSKVIILLTKQMLTQYNR